MKCVIWIFLLPLKYGVFGADEMKTVTEGDYLTLQTGFSEIQSDDRIVWLYGSDIIARIDKESGIFKTYDVDDGRFKGKLELDKQTGSLTIKDIRIKNAGDYQLEKKGVTAGKFKVTVYARLPTPAIGFSECAPTPAGSSSPICVVQCSVQTVGLVTLSWYKGNNLVSTRISDTCSSTFLRLEVDYDDKKTYSCIVNNPISNQTRHLDISGLCHTCAVSGLPPAAVASIVAAVLLVAAAAAGVIYYYHKISELRKHKYDTKTESVTEGQLVILKSELTDVRNDDQILWMYGAQEDPIAEIRGGVGETFDGADGKFKDKLKLDETTGSLTIKNTKIGHSGLYTLQISSSNKTANKKFIVYICENKIIKKESNDATLETDTKIQTDDLILWMFGAEDNLIAQKIGDTRAITTYDGRFKNNLELDNDTGSLTIRKIKYTHDGFYKLKIISGSRTLNRKFRLVITGDLEPKTVSVMAGKDLIISTDFCIQRGEQVEWCFGGKNLANGMNRDTKRTSYGDDERFKGRLELNHQTGDLTIKKSRTSDTGAYNLRIFSNTISGKNINRSYNATVLDSTENRVKESATVEMPLLIEEDLDVMNEEEGTSSL